MLLDNQNVFLDSDTASLIAGVDEGVIDISNRGLESAELTVFVLHKTSAVTPTTITWYVEFSASVDMSSPTTVGSFASAPSSLTVPAGTMYSIAVPRNRILGGASQSLSYLSVRAVASGAGDAGELVMAWLGTSKDIPVNEEGLS